MKRFLSPAAFAVLLVFAANAAHADVAKDGRVCTLETVVGSHLPKRVCTTATERDAMRKASQEKMGNLKSQARVGGTRTGGAN